MQQIRAYAIAAAIGLLAGVLATLAFTCKTDAVIPPTPARPIAGPKAPVVEVRQGTEFFDSAKHLTRRIDTEWRTVYVATCDSPCVRSQPEPAAILKPAFNWSFAGQLAAPLIAAFEPQDPRNFFEVYAKAGHDLFQGGYGGAVMAFLNLDRIHVANATVYGELGYLHGFYFAIGVLGKLFGWL